MKTLTVRDLNRKTASVVNAVERGEIFELRRRGKAVGYLTSSPPTVKHKPDWKTHFDWLRKQTTKTGAAILGEFEEDRRRQRSSEQEMGG